jgi:uncharacterized protein (DUF111 family)
MTLFVQCHAHWDCSQGVSSSAMLVACFRAVQAEDDVFAQWIQELQADLASLFSSRFGLDVLWLHVRGRTVAVNTYIEVIQEFDATEKFVDKLVQDESVLSLFAKTMSIAVLAELERVEHCRPPDVLPVSTLEQTTRAVEIVACMWILDRLGVRSTSYSPLQLTTNNPQRTWRAHEIFKGMTVIMAPDELENKQELPCQLSFDTGAAMLKVLCPQAERSHDRPLVQLRCVSTGADATIPGLVMALALGDVPTTAERTKQHQSSSFWRMNDTTVLETNIDDMTAEHVAFCVDRLMLAGANDAWTTPIVMKKGRLAVTLSCLTTCELENEMLELMFRHTSTLGIRIRHVQRASLQRRIVHVQFNATTNVAVKIGYLNNVKDVVNVKPEFDDCRAISLATNIPLQVISSQVTRMAQEKLLRQDNDNNKRSSSS